MISVQDISDHTLLRVINEGSEVNWNFFAFRVMISRLKLKLSMMNSDEDKQQCYTEMRELFQKSSNIPNAQKDLQLIMERFEKDISD